MSLAGSATRRRHRRTKTILETTPQIEGTKTKQFPSEYFKRNHITPLPRLIAFSSAKWAHLHTCTSFLSDEWYINQKWRDNLALWGSKLTPFNLCIKNCQALEYASNISKTATTIRILHESLSASSVHSLAACPNPSNHQWPL